MKGREAADHEASDMNAHHAMNRLSWAVLLALGTLAFSSAMRCRTSVMCSLSSPGFLRTGSSEAPSPERVDDFAPPVVDLLCRAMS